MTTPVVVSGIGLVQPEGPVRDDWFDHRTELGRRGYKYLPAASQYLLAAARRALTDSKDALAAVPPERRGMATATNTGINPVHDDLDAIVLDGGADRLFPPVAPYFAVNLFSTKVATEQAVKGFNITLTTPRVAGLEAVETGLRCLAADRAHTVLAGVAEAAFDGEPGSDTAEAGAVALLLEPAASATARGLRPLGRLAAHSCYLSPQTASAAHGHRRAGALLTAAFAALGHRADNRPPVTAVLDDSPVGRAVAAALGQDTTHLPAGSGALAPLLRVAAALRAGGGPSLVVTAAAEGNVAVCQVTPDPTGSASAEHRDHKD